MQQRVGDARAVSRLGMAGIVGLLEIVEAMHSAIARMPRLHLGAAPPTTTGITGFVYRRIRGVMHAVGQSLEYVLARLEPMLRERSTWRGRKPLLTALNGVLGDYLAASNSPLAIPMCLRHAGLPLPIERVALAAAVPEATGKLVVLLHGLCMSDLAWHRKGHDHGAALAADLGYTPVYLYYNTGLHVSANGRAFADLLERLVRKWPVPVTELVLIGHSMGGLVARSACHYAGLANHGWLPRLDALMFLGTPHHGAPLERGGNWVDLLLGSNACSAPLARFGKIRSAGITDLRFGNVVDEDWNRRGRFVRTRDLRTPVPLPDHLACYAIAATTGSSAGNLGDDVIGDGLVPVPSALGRHSDPRLTLSFDASRQWIARGMNHLDLLSGTEVYGKIRSWLEAPQRGVAAAQHTGYPRGVVAAVSP